MDYSIEKSQQRLAENIDWLESLGWISLGSWLFFKGGKIYDLSAADLAQLERIEREGLFVRGE